jgi:hypothetical protein
MHRQQVLGMFRSAKFEIVGPNLCGWEDSAPGRFRVAQGMQLAGRKPIALQWSIEWNLSFG